MGSNVGDVFESPGRRNTKQTILSMLDRGEGLRAGNLFGENLVWGGREIVRTFDQRVMYFLV